MTLYNGKVKGLLLRRTNYSDAADASVPPGNALLFFDGNVLRLRSKDLNESDTTIPISFDQELNTTDTPTFYGIGSYVHYRHQEVTLSLGVLAFTGGGKNVDAVSEDSEHYTPTTTGIQVVNAGLYALTWQFRATFSDDTTNTVTLTINTLSGQDVPIDSFSTKARDTTNVDTTTVACLTPIVSLPAGGQIQFTWGGDELTTATSSTMIKVQRLQ